MKKIILAFLFLLSGLSFSAIEMGNYTGIDEDALPCSISFKEKSFLEGHVQNPINERFKILLNEKEYTAHYPVLVNHETRDVTYNPKYLYAHYGTSDGAFLISIYISDDEGGEGPLSYEVVDQNWRRGSKEVSRCFGLVHRE